MTAQHKRDLATVCRSRNSATLARRPLPAAIVFMLAAAVWFSPSPLRAADAARSIPAPALDETPVSGAATEVAVLAGGCFWGVQGVFQHTKGVTTAMSGYAGGDKQSAHYNIVSSGGTGHAESVRVTFDPRQISYGRILQIYFSVAHDPTELDRQGPDVGTQYRSAVFTANAEQAKIAKAYIAQLNQAGVFDAAIVTEVTPLEAFYAAEAYHQNFLAANPTYPYIVINDLPKVENLRRVYPDLYRADPVLVATAGMPD
jgi:peptide-methionine (S)-S-oxide reductase